MRSAEVESPASRWPGLALRVALAILLTGAAAAASPVRVATLGRDGRLLLDATNIFLYPALARELAHVDVELFDDWAGAVVPVGDAAALGLFLNRPSPSTDDLSGYLAGTGSRLLRSLEPRPWLDVVGGVRARGIDWGLGVRYAYDVRDLGAREASASQWEGSLGATVGVPTRRLEGSVRLQRVRLRDHGEAVARSQTGGNGFGLDLRGRWAMGADGVLLPALSWWHSGTGLAPQERRLDRVRGSLGWNGRPAPTVLAVAGLVVAAERERLDTPGDGLSASERRRYLLPAVVAGGEVQAGSLLLRLGLRHESVVTEDDRPAGVDLSFDTAFTADVGVGIEVGNLVIDGILEKDFLRDGPHFLGGSPRGAGLLSTLSLAYRLYP